MPVQNRGLHQAGADDRNGGAGTQRFKPRLVEQIEHDRAGVELQAHADHGAEKADIADRALHAIGLVRPLAKLHPFGSQGDRAAVARSGALQAARHPQMATVDLDETFARINDGALKRLSVPTKEATNRVAGKL